MYNTNIKKFRPKSKLKLSFKNFDKTYEFL